MTPPAEVLIPGSLSSLTTRPHSTCGETSSPTTSASETPPRGDLCVRSSERLSPQSHSGGHLLRRGWPCGWGASGWSRKSVLGGGPAPRQCKSTLPTRTHSQHRRSVLRIRHVVEHKDDLRRVSCPCACPLMDSNGLAPPQMWLWVEAGFSKLSPPKVATVLYSSVDTKKECSSL